MIKAPIQEEDITMINIYAPSIGAPQYIKQMLTSIKWEIDSKTIIVGDFNTLLPIIERSSKQKINLETQTPPGLYTPDVKTSCLVISAHISNLRSVCLKLLYFKNNVVWTNRILEGANLVLFISGGMNEAPLGYPGSAGHWAQIPPLLCSPRKGSLCVQNS